MKPLTIEINFHNNIYIWVQKEGILDKKQCKVSANLSMEILKFMAKQGIIIDDERGTIQFDISR